MNPVAPFGCLYLSIQIESVLAYGRGTENRTLINRLKAYYFAVKLYPRYLITLVTCHDRSPFKKFGSQYKNRTCNKGLSSLRYTI